MANISRYSRRTDSPSADSFSRLRVSNPTGVFSSQAQYDYDPILYEVGGTSATRGSIDYYEIR